MEGPISIQAAGQQFGQTRRQPDILAFFDNAFDWFFYVYVFATIALPGGSFYGFNFKSPMFLGLLPLSVYSLFHRKQATPTEIALAIAVPAILTGWVVLGLSNGFALSGVMRQYMDILITVLICWLATIFCNNDETRRIKFLRLILNAVLAAAVLKIAVIAYAVIRGIPVVQMVQLLDKIFDTELMTMDLGDLFGRVQFVSDGLIPVCVFILLRHRDRLKIGNALASLMILLLLISVTFSFSRFFWGFTAFAFIVGLALGKRDRFQLSVIVVLSLSFLAALPALVSVYQLRFSTAVAGGSDELRTEQVPPLLRFFTSAPFFGHGMGSYTNEDVRGETEAGRAAYEVQLLSVPAQIGLLGTSLFLILGFYYYDHLWWKSPLKWSDRIGITLLLAFWVAAGLTNPLLFHPLSGINYAALATLATLRSKKNATLTPST
ncbi:O-antigen ligase family protein [Granulicella mallensis]|uniref:O-antigen polymerase n=1 Tax=Granulicella mallensis (strain ATCC BAA-1857 / DSM 23137 / MP5ACTX8) TaxID=682795 RepID=G8NZN4_GRAMM|nr:O-antigen ligase family protein [Granulicella mallensis]AEU39154.1 O-antigen polymerase [Granulicella mallensis MP5ACTX8]